MKKTYYAVFGGIVCVAAVVLLFRIFLRRPSSGTQGVASANSLSLIIEPDDGIAPVLAMISRATASVDMVIYELDDPRIESALVADVARGVAVRVILSAGYYGASSTSNGAAYDFLAARGVAVRWSPGYFSLTHQKSIVVDKVRALIMTFNLVAKYYPTGRDFGIVDSDPRDVAAIETTFDGDWRGSGAGADSGDSLLWSPGSEPALIALINSAKRSLSIYNEEMADSAVTKALIDAARRGVGVYIDMTGASEWKWEFEELTTAGAHVRTYVDADDAPLYIHAKMVIADGESASARAFIGSENFSTGSLYGNRELGVIFSDPTIIRALLKTFAADWRAATPFVP